MNADEFGAALGPKLKQAGFRKKDLNWYRNLGEVTVVLNIQKSQFSPDIWYYNYGFGINCFYSEPITGIRECDITYRFDQSLNQQTLTPDDVARILQMWIDNYGSVEKLRSLAYRGKLPPATTERVKHFLLSGYTAG